ncbi:MAG: GxxExxY protein [Saprospirales bacterium]|nr:GxxExxY protein [Saprospirales bacterium]MBK6904842.1 GxxExxY protein [Saprospirales bacterium]MBK7338353.1 GxxExxY protein [Saprospirales bacterium]
MRHEEIARAIVHAAYQVHNALGPGLLESVYEHCMIEELGQAGVRVESQKPIPVVYKSRKLELGFRADLIVENKVLVELKAVDAISPLHLAQILTYLKLTQISLGFLINFNEHLIKQGIKRVANNYSSL